MENWRWRRIQFIKCQEIGEALAACCAVELAKEQDFQHVAFEGNCKSLIDQLQNIIPSLSPAGSIIEETNRILTVFNYAFFILFKLPICESIFSFAVYIEFSVELSVVSLV